MTDISSKPKAQSFHAILLIFFTIIILIISFTPVKVFSQDTSIIKYLPLAVGNSWTYFAWNPQPPPSTWKVKFTITKDTVMNGKRYYRCQFPVIGLSWLRIDSIKGIVYRAGSSPGCSPVTYEVLVDSLYSKLNDTANDCSGYKRKCKDTNNIPLFNSVYKSKKFEPLLALSANTKTYAKYFGLCGLSEGDPYVISYSLLGCVINGVVYGDTSVPLGIQPISSEIPNEYILFQNYPNPFNPNTVISYSVGIPSGQLVVSSFTTLKVYDVLGHEVATLVNEQLKPGTYEANFDGSDLASEVYYYILNSGDFIESKRMVLLK
jgi:hypothetical protein